MIMNQKNKNSILIHLLKVLVVCVLFFVLGLFFGMPLIKLVIGFLLIMVIAGVYNFLYFNGFLEKRNRKD
ncbi:hypothetical protein CW354_04485 [Marinicaulis flavus]|uniref:Uncharacterized protein n=1 Tax=Hyphococcus luteus TaxID=2058213 RepID=A0A2S7K9N3_9PROT|nr:hypothetical protein CW354_04485 [Marinicaulis flavus]